MKREHPPKWANRFLRWYCKPEILEDLEGDLHEYFIRNLEKSKRKANWTYWKMVLGFFRPYVIRKPKFMNLFRMADIGRNFAKTSWRNINANKFFSSVNIVGLSISMAVGLLMITLINELTHYDEFHDDTDSMYRLISTYSSTQDDPVQLATSSIKLARALEEASSIQDLTILERSFRGTAKKEDNIVSVRGLYASESFFDLFSFKLVNGHTSNVLNEPNTVVLTESMSEKLFDSNPIGEMIEMNNGDQYMVSGVVKDPPFNSHIKFDALASLATLETKAISDPSSKILNWTSIWGTYTYFRIKEGQKSNLVASLSRISNEENQKLENISITYDLQPFTKIVPGKNLSNQLSSNLDFKFLYFLIGLTFIVLLSACFNYTNLSIAKSMRRAREVGVRKVLGASKSQVFFQFVTEAVMISLIAMLIAITLLTWIKPLFLTTIPPLASKITLASTGIIYLYFLGFAIIVGLVAGFFPSLFMTKVKSLLVLKDVSKMQLYERLNFKKVLIVFQFMISLIFMIVTIGLYKQYRYALNQDLGFTTENIVNISLQGQDYQVLQTELEKMSEVELVSKSSLIVSTGDSYIVYGKAKDPTDSARVAHSSIDENYLAIHDLKLLSGNNFQTGTQTENESIIVNHAFVKRFALGTPEEAINQIVSINGRPIRIRGVVTDFYDLTLKDPIRPFAFRYAPSDWSYLNVAVTQSSGAVMSALRSTWEAVAPNQEFKGSFYDQSIQDTYSEAQAIAKVIGFLSLVVISIAILGLLGMAIYTTESRIKEIGIRKVMGATEVSIMYLLSKGYIVLLIISGLLAVPLAILWLRSQFEFLLLDGRSQMTEVILGLFIILGLGLTIILGRTFLAARSNPADILRSE